jgi:hypothetical protein
MGQNQWIELRIVADGVDLWLDPPDLKLGHLYDPHAGRDAMVAASDLSGYRIHASREFHIGACGFRDDQAGTEGTLVLRTAKGAIGRYFWECSGGPHANRSVWTALSPGFDTALRGGHLHGGALGAIVLHCRYLGALPR